MIATNTTLNIPPVEDLMGTIHKQASYAYQRLLCPHGMEYEDLVSEGQLVYCQCIKSYDGRAKFITWLTICLKNRFASIVRDSYRTREYAASDYMDNVSRPSPNTPEDAPQRLLSRLTGKARQYAEEMIEPSTGFIDAWEQRPKGTQRKTCLADYLDIDRRKIHVVLARIRKTFDRIEFSA